MANAVHKLRSEGKEERPQQPEQRQGDGAAVAQLRRPEQLRERMKLRLHRQACGGVSMHACVPDLDHASGLVGFLLCPDLKGVRLSASCSGPCTNAGAVLQLFFVFFLVCISLNLVSRDFHAATYAIVSCIMILLIIFE